MFVLSVASLLLIAKTQCQPLQTYQKFTGMKISGSTTLTNYNFSLADDSVCAWKCTALGSSCFAAQYDLNSKICQLQLNCGSVWLETAASNNYVVYVPQSLVTSNSSYARPSFYFPLVYGCSADLSSYYSVSNAALSVVPLNVDSVTQNAYSALATTISMTDGSYSRVQVTDVTGSGSLNVFGAPFTISFLYQCLTDDPEFAPVTFYTSSADANCFIIRVSPRSNVLFIAFYTQCSCAYSVHYCFVSKALTVYWTHVALTYSNGYFQWFINGTLQSVCQQSFTAPTLTPTRIVLGVTEECSSYWLHSTPPGSIACFAIYNSALLDSEVMTSYLQCLYGGVYT